MTIKEFKELGFTIDILSNAYAYGAWNFEKECIVIDQYETDFDNVIEYRILDKNHELIENDFWNISDVLEYIKGM